MVILFMFFYMAVYLVKCAVYIKIRETINQKPVFEYLFILRKKYL